MKLKAGLLKFAVSPELSLFEHSAYWLTKCLRQTAEDPDPMWLSMRIQVVSIEIDVKPPFMLDAAHLSKHKKRKETRRKNSPEEAKGLAYFQHTNADHPSLLTVQTVLINTEYGFYLKMLTPMIL